MTVDHSRTHPSELFGGPGDGVRVELAELTEFVLHNIPWSAARINYQRTSEYTKDGRHVYVYRGGSARASA